MSEPKGDRQGGLTVKCWDGYYEVWRDSEKLSAHPDLSEALAQALTKIGIKVWFEYPEEEPDG